MKKTFFLGIILIIALFINSTSSAELLKINNSITSINNSAEWTFMVYLDGDNNLEGNAIDDFLEMSTVGSTENVNIVVQFDRCSSYDSRYGNWETTYRYYITKDMVPTVENALQDLGEANMGDPQTAIDFIDWAVENYPANKYCFVFWDHGSGWRPVAITSDTKGVCDDETNNDYLGTLEIKEILQSVTNNGVNKFEHVGFDACFMQMVEIGYEIRNYAKYMTASEASEPLDGWEYDLTLEELITDPYCLGDTLGRYIIDHFPGVGDITLSNVNLQIYNELTVKISKLAEMLMKPTYREDMGKVLEDVFFVGYFDYVDLYDFVEQVVNNIDDENILNKANELMDIIDKTVTYEKHGNGMGEAHGISIYFYHEYYSIYEPTYELLEFSVDTKWDDLIKWYYEIDGDTPSKPRINGYDNGGAGVTYSYFFTSVDPQGDNIYYYIDWGDGTAEEYIGPYNSGKSCKVTHSWEDTGTYLIRAKARDENGHESDWSTYNIAMPKAKNKIFQNNFFNILFEKFPMLLILLK